MFLAAPWLLSTALLTLASLSAAGADWDPRLAASYLDQRQKEWFAWAPAKAPGGPCVSCHTGATYLLARPALRKALAESKPTEYESGLLQALRARSGKITAKEVFPGFTEEPKASQALGVESIHSALFLAMDESGRGTWSEETRQAFERLWSFQLVEGKDKGAWPWFSLKLDPWEMPHSAFYGATLAAMAVGAAPASYRSSPEVRRHVRALVEYLQREEPTQSLHMRLMALWAATALPEALPAARRKRIIREAGRLQKPDGGWTLASLGPWDAHPAASPSAGSDSYATALIGCVLIQSGVKPSHPSLSRALDWLRAHQNPKDGSWQASSMNKKYPQGSVQETFMTTAATAYAVLALTRR